VPPLHPVDTAATANSKDSSGSDVRRVMASPASGRWWR
jgi:hypothetical protein